MYLCGGIYEDPGGNWHELDRAIILLIGVAAFELCTSLPVKPLILRYVAAYIPSQLLVFAYVWFTSLREPLAKTAYQDIWINFTGLFIVLSVANAIAIAGAKCLKQKEINISRQLEALKESGKNLGLVWGFLHRGCVALSLVRCYV